MGRSTYDEFYSSAYRPLVAQLYALTGNLAHAEEIAQEAFVRAWAAWDRIAAYEDPRAWVRQVGFRIGVSRWRQAGRVARALVRHGPPEDVPGPGPLSVAVVTALRAVPIPQRRALVLHYLCGMSVSAIAHEEGVRDGTVKSRLSRGRACMAELLKDEPLNETAARGRP